MHIGKGTSIKTELKITWVKLPDKGEKEEHEYCMWCRFTTPVVDQTNYIDESIIE